MKGKDFDTIDNTMRFMAERITTGRTVGRVTYFDAVVAVLISARFMICGLILLTRFYIIKAIEVTVGKVSDRINDWAWNSYEALDRELDDTYLAFGVSMYDRFKDRLSDFDRNIIEISLQEFSE